MKNNARYTKIVKVLGVFMILIGIIGLYALHDAERVARSAWQAVYMSFVLLGGVCNLFDFGKGKFPMLACFCYIIATVLSVLIGIIFRKEFPFDSIAMMIALLISLSRYGSILISAGEKKSDDVLGEKNHLEDPELDLLYEKAVGVVLDARQPYPSVLQKELGISWSNSKRLISKMEDKGIVSHAADDGSRKILAQTSDDTPLEIEDSISKVDMMEGHAFEEFTAELLRKLGYEWVQVTQGSGDQGVDVIAVKDGKKYAIQCKRYNQKLGNKPVQEVYAGKTIYGCSVAVVLTNNYFTDGAKEAAQATGVELWDRDTLRRMLVYAEHREAAKG